VRILGFSKRWEKLEQPTFTTFRFKRRDADWEVGETVQVVYKPRRKGGGDKLGIAEIVSKESRLGAASDDEAREDGFQDCRDMERWMIKTYGEAKTWQPMNKLTLYWIKANILIKGIMIE